MDAVGTWNLVATLSESTGVTTATLTEVIDDPKMIENTSPGSEYYLDRLVAAQAGSDPDAVGFADYHPAQRDYYLAIQEAVIASALPPARPRLGRSAGSRPQPPFGRTAAVINVRPHD